MPALSFEQIRERLAARFGDAIGPTVPAKDPFVVVRAERLLDVCRHLHDDPELALDYLLDETGVDYPKENQIRLVYHLWSMKLRHGFKLKVECDRADPKAPSVFAVWRAANWLEREVFDLFGVRFEGHPDLRRIMMPDDWQGHPLRKDFQESGGYQGVSNTRVNPLDVLLERDRELRAQSPGAVVPAAAAESSKPAAAEAAKTAPAEAAKAAPAEAAKAAPAEAAKAAPAEAAKTAPAEAAKAAPAEAPKAAAAEAAVTAPETKAKEGAA